MDFRGARTVQKEPLRAIFGRGMQLFKIAFFYKASQSLAASDVGTGRAEDLRVCVILAERRVVRVLHDV